MPQRLALARLPSNPLSLSPGNAQQLPLLYLQQRRLNQLIYDADEILDNFEREHNIGVSHLTSSYPWKNLELFAWRCFGRGLPRDRS